MENKSQSYNTSVVGLSPLKFLIPQAPQLILYLFVSLLILLALNVPAIWDLLTAGSGLSGVAAQDSGFYKAWHLVSSSNLVAGLFWGALGCVFYLVIWFFRSIVTNIRNDLVVASYVHPVTYKEYLYWRSVILRKVFFGLSFLTLLAYLFALTKLFGGLANFCYWRAENGLNYTGYIQLLGAVVAGMLLLHGFTLILKLTLNFWQFIYRDL
jgi:hypothetical protein